MGNCLPQGHRKTLLQDRIRNQTFHQACNAFSLFWEFSPFGRVGASANAWASNQRVPWAGGSSEPRNMGGQRMVFGKRGQAKTEQSCFGIQVTQLQVWCPRPWDKGGFWDRAGSVDGEVYWCVQRG